MPDYQTDARLADSSVMGEKSVIYRAVSIPKALLPGVNPDNSKAILIERDRDYVVIGLMLSPDRRREAVGMGYLAGDGTEEMVFTSPEDFPGLSL